MAGGGVVTANDAKPRMGGRKLALLITAAILVLGSAGAAAAYFTGLVGTPHGGESPAHTEAPAAGEQAVAEPGTAGPAAIVFVDMPDMIVNLQSDAPRMRFLKLRVALEVADEPTAVTVRQLLPRVMDGFQLYLRALTVDDTRGAAGMQRLKEELIARVNLAVEPVRVNDVLLKEMLVQ